MTLIDPKESDAAEWARRVLTETDSGREVARAYFYALERGLPGVLTGSFDIPTCGNWDCMSPGHQSWVPSPSPHGSASRSRAPNGKADR
jgi:hypothetical protein